LELSSVWNVDLKINNQHTRNTGRGNEDHRGRLNLADASQVHRACRRRLGVRLRRGPGLRVMRRSCGRPSAPHVAPRRRVRGQDGKSDPILDCVGPAQRRGAPLLSPRRHTLGVYGHRKGARAPCAPATCSQATHASQAEVTPNVKFDTIAREWRCKWSADGDKASLVKAQDELSAIIKEVSSPSPSPEGHGARTVRVHTKTSLLHTPSLCRPFALPFRGSTGCMRSAGLSHLCSCLTCYCIYARPSFLPLIPLHSLLPPGLVSLLVSLAPAPPPGQGREGCEKRAARRVRRVPGLQGCDGARHRFLWRMGGVQIRARGEVPCEDQGHPGRDPGRDPDLHSHAYVSCTCSTCQQQEYRA